MNAADHCHRRREPGRSVRGSNAPPGQLDGDVILIGAESQLPYERPALSKQYLRGELAFEKMLVRPAAFYVSDRRINAVVALNRGKDLRRAMPLIKARTTVDSAQLKDEGVDLRNLLHA